MLLIGTKNIGTQTVLTDGIVNIDGVYRKYCKKNACGISAFSRTTTDITLQHSGIYHISASFIVSAPAAGTVTVQLLQNGVAVDGAFASETITTPTTELRSMFIDYYILVDKGCVLDTESTLSQTISFQNIGDDATFTSVIVNVDKVV